MAALKKGKKPKKPKYSAAERKAYWLGVGFHAGQSFGMRSEELCNRMTEKEQNSFVNGRMKADDLSAKFVPDLVSGKTGRNRSKKVKTRSRMR